MPQCRHTQFADPLLQSLELPHREVQGGGAHGIST
jgi:hypothetical protein